MMAGSGKKPSTTSSSSNPSQAQTNQSRTSVPPPISTYHNTPHDLENSKYEPQEDKQEDDDDDDDDDDQYLNDHRTHQEQAHVSLLSSLPSTQQTRTKPSSSPEPCRSSSFLISCIVVFGLFFTFFLLGPATYKVFHPIKSIRPQTQPQPQDSSSSSHTHSNNQETNSSPSQSKNKFIKPTGPPGSIINSIDHWANQGGNWKGFNPELNSKLAQDQAHLSNGTHKFNKTVIVVSLDGFRAEYLERNLSPRMILIKEKLGISSNFLRPQFPTLTFPNHWSMLTGLYPESHGIIANDFRDPKLSKSFSNIDPHKSWDPVWWSGEPIWAIATKHGIPTAVSMWPGPPYTSDKTRPTYWRPFEDRYKWWKKIRQLETWLDLPVGDRPQLITLYLPEVDQIGHHYGPDDLRLNKTLQSIDQFVGSLYDSLKVRNLTEIIDVIYVGDHGMMATDDSRIVYLDKILGSAYFNQIQFQDGWPAAGLRFPADVDTKPILERLIDKSKSLPGFEVYTHETMPKRWHFTNNQRIAPIYVFPKPGWVISNTHEHQVVMNGTYNVKGVHGYDNEEKLMQSIFIGHGPFSEEIRRKQLRTIKENSSSSFRRRSEPRSNSNLQRYPINDGDNQQAIIVGKLPGFSNLEVFSLISKLLNLDPFINFHNLNCSIGFWDQFFF